MADTFWTGRVIYNSNAERDDYAKRVEDFIAARSSVIPEMNMAFTTDSMGSEHRNNLQLGDDSGFGFIFSVKMPARDSVVGEAETLFAEITDPALNGEGGFNTP